MLFEVTDVILQTSENSIGAKNQRRLAAIRTNNDSAELSVMYLYNKEYSRTCGLHNAEVECAI